MAIAFVSRANTNTHVVSGTSVASPARAHTAGNLLVVVVLAQGASFTGCTDTAGNTYTASTTTPFMTASGINYVGIFYAKNITGHATNVVTCTFGGTYNYLTIAVYEINGADTTAPFLADSTGSGTGTALSTGSLTLTGSSAVVAIYTVGSAPTAGTGYTQFQQDDGAFVFDSYHITSTSEAATATQAGVFAWDIFAASFKTAAAGRPAGRKTLLGAGR